MISLLKIFSGSSFEEMNRKQMGFVYSPYSTDSTTFSAGRVTSRETSGTKCATSARGPVSVFVTGSRRRLRELCRTEESQTSDFWEDFLRYTRCQVGCFEEHDWTRDFLESLQAAWSHARQFSSQGN